MAEKKSVTKKKNAVKKKATTVQKKKSPVKKAATSKVKKTVAKKVTKKPAVKSKTKVSRTKKPVATKAKPKAKKPATKKPVKKNIKKAIADVNIDIKNKKGKKSQNKKVVSVIDKLSLTNEQNYVTTVPGVFRKVPAAQKVTVAPVHKELPITGILNYVKGMF
ncbi:MAG: hypothetical protein R2568_10920 [Candidatus Scalindua sp.]|jgi:hypothetical protein|nr:hypothetical protein [Candidatus Scalindua sp.]MDV5167237.1 hypothetical protein [Candidatus Scalindua sp.]